MQRIIISRLLPMAVGSVLMVASKRCLTTCATTRVIRPFTNVQTVYTTVTLNKRYSSETAEGDSASRGTAYLLDRNDVLNRVLEVVKNFEKVDASKVTPESHFVNDLGLNSLDVVEIVFAIEQEFILDIPDHDAEKIQSIPDAVEYVAQNPMAK